MPRKRSPDLDVGQLATVLAGDQACRNLQLYFGVGLALGETPSFTGGRFELMDGGGDRAGVCNRVTPWDVLSLELLSVQLPPRVTLDLLEGALGQEAAVFLERIPASAQLWDEETEELIEDDGPTDGIWHLLESQAGVGWVMAGKLLARKRPSLIPVYDQIVRCAYGWPENIWKALRKALRQDDSYFRMALEDLKNRAGIPVEIGLLRTLDVAIWMHHRPHHTGYDCTGLS
jgi:hypothetical protein